MQGIGPSSPLILRAKNFHELSGLTAWTHGQFAGHGTWDMNGHMNCCLLRSGFRSNKLQKRCSFDLEGIWKRFVSYGPTVKPYHVYC